MTHWSMDKRAPGVLKKKKTATTTLQRHVRNASYKRCQVANSQCTRIGTLCIANRASPTSSFNIQHLPVIVKYTVYVDTRCFL